MRIIEAIEEARKDYDWVDINHPTSVIVGFINKNGRTDETELDLYSGEMEAELENLWSELAEELGSDIDLIEYVDMIGYIRV